MPSVEALGEVQGIGEKRLETLRERAAAVRWAPPKGDRGTPWSAAPRRARSRVSRSPSRASGPDGASGESGAGGPGGASGPDRPPRAGESHAVQPPPPPSAPPRPGPARIGRRPWQVAAACIALGLALAPLGPGTALVVGALAGGGLMVPRARALAALALLLVVGGALAGEWRLAALDSRSERIDDGRELALAAHLVSRPRPSVFGEHGSRGRGRITTRGGSSPAAPASLG